MVEYNKNNRPRFSAEITPEQANILAQILPHGSKKPLVQVVVQGIISLYRSGGQPALGDVISRAISIEQLISVGLKDTRRVKIESLERKLEELRREQDES